MVALKHVVGVSWPRSGHHLLVRLLSRYLRKDFIYCMNRTVQEAVGRRKQSCCEGTLCDNRANVHFCKNHDTRGTVPQVSGQLYLVQYRDFLPAVVSSFECHLKVSNSSDTFDAFKVMSRNRVDRYRAFLDKWVHSNNSGIERLVVRYEDLTSRPEETMIGVLGLFGVDEKDVNLRRLRRIIEVAPKKTLDNNKEVNVKDHGVANTRRVEDFRHYRADWFAELERMIKAG